MLTPELARDTAAQAIDLATRLGADAADAVLIAGTSVSVSVRLGKLEDVDRSEGSELGLRVFVGQRSASVSTADLNGDALAALAERAVAMARAAPEDRWAGLAPAERLLKGVPPSLDLDDGGEGDPARLKDRALAAEDAARAVPGITNSDGGGASFGRSTVALATSHGFCGGYASTSYSVSASVHAGPTGNMRGDYAHHSARHEKRLEAPELVGQRAGERTIAKLNPVRIESGAMPVVFDPRVGGSLIGHLIGAIAGTAITRRTSFLLDALGTEVFAPGITIVDDPHLPHGLRSRPFDGEGLPVSPTKLIDRGVLQGWLLDSASARQLGLEPTGHATRGLSGAPGIGVTNVHLEPGTLSPQAMLAEVGNGIYVTELIGQGVNGVTGDYSRGAAGFLIRDGVLGPPVEEITIAGNLKQMYRALTAANDLEFRYGINVPTLRVDGMTIASG